MTNKISVKALTALYELHADIGGKHINAFDGSEEWRIKSIDWAVALNAMLDMRQFIDRSEYTEEGVYNAFDNSLLTLIATTAKMKKVYLEGK